MPTRSLRLPTLLPVVAATTLLLPPLAQACGWPEYRMAESGMPFYIAGHIVWTSLVLAYVLPPLPESGVKRLLIAGEWALLVLITVALWGVFFLAGREGEAQIDPIYGLVGMTALSGLLFLMKRSRRHSRRIFVTSCTALVLYTSATLLTFGTFSIPFTLHDPFAALEDAPPRGG